MDTELSKGYQGELNSIAVTTAYTRGCSLIAQFFCLSAVAGEGEREIMQEFLPPNCFIFEGLVNNSSVKIGFPTATYFNVASRASSNSVKPKMLMPDMAEEHNQW
jgi:hypothetical protein